MLAFTGMFSRKGSLWYIGSQLQGRCPVGSNELQRFATAWSFIVPSQTEFYIGANNVEQYVDGTSALSRHLKLRMLIVTQTKFTRQMIADCNVRHYTENVEASLCLSYKGCFKRWPDKNICASPAWQWRATVVFRSQASVWSSLLRMETQHACTGWT